MGEYYKQNYSALENNNQRFNYLINNVELYQEDSKVVEAAFNDIQNGVIEIVCKSDALQWCKNVRIIFYRGERERYSNQVRHRLR
jgi:hypothetical protein